MIDQAFRLVPNSVLTVPFEILMPEIAESFWRVHDDSGSRSPLVAKCPYLSTPHIDRSIGAKQGVTDWQP
jgi:hypothetical protein